MSITKSKNKKKVLEDLFDTNGSKIFTEKEKKSLNFCKTTNINNDFSCDKANKLPLVDLSGKQFQEGEIFTMWKVTNYLMNDKAIEKNILKLFLDEKIHILENSDESYHDRIDPKKKYKFFGDIDYYSKTFDFFRDKLILFLRDFYGIDITENDIKYTINKGKKGSYHFVIPKFHCYPVKIKEILDNMYVNDKEQFTHIDENGRKKKIIDTCIYSVHWFRCPNQTKQGEIGTKHIIVKGDMKDFIFDYIENDSKQIDNIMYIPKIVKMVTSDSKKKSDANIFNKIKKTKKVKIIQLSEDDNENKEDENENNYKKNLNNIKDKILKTEQSILYKFFDHCYLPVRFSDYKYWINVGMALKNRFGNEGFDLFKYFSFKCPSHDTENELKIKYNSFNNKSIEKKINISTLYFYAKEDNQKIYIELIKKYSLFKNFDMTSTTIINYIRMLKPNDFIWKKGELYCYNGKYWEKDPIHLMIFIGNDLFNFLRDILQSCYFDSKEAINMTKSLFKLRNLAFKKELVETSREIFRNDEQMFDYKEHLFGFKNVVLDLTTFQFRDYKYDDYITVTTGYDWIEPEKSKIDKINQLIETIHPDEHERQLYLEILSTGLSGENIQRFTLFNGKGANGKGLINDLCLKAFGNYGLIGNNALLFEINKSGSNPEKNNMHNKRFIIFREPAEKSKIENSIMKEYTGGGGFSARGLYDSNTEKILSCTIILECNKRPLFKEEPTQADLRRIIDIYFPRKFTDIKEDVDESKNIFLANSDYRLIEFQCEHRTSLIKILLDAYKSYKERGRIFKIPKSIENRTKLYLQMSSSIFTWVTDNYEKTENKNDIIKLHDVFNNFKTSDYYFTLTKKEQNKYNKKYFLYEISENVFINKFYRSEAKINNKHYHNILTNYKMIESSDYDDL